VGGRNRSSITLLSPMALIRHSRRILAGARRIRLGDLALDPERRVSSQGLSPSLSATSCSADGAPRCTRVAPTGYLSHHAIHPSATVLFTFPGGDEGVPRMGWGGSDIILAMEYDALGLGG